jgi:hypothetical protein
MDFNCGLGRRKFFLGRGLATPDLKSEWESIKFKFLGSQFSAALLEIFQSIQAEAGWL